MEDVAGAVVVCAVAASEGYDAVTPAAVRILQHVFHWHLDKLCADANLHRLFAARSRGSIQDVEKAIESSGSSFALLKEYYKDAATMSLPSARTPPLPESFDPLVEEALAQLPVDDVLPKPEKIPSHLPPWPRAHTFKRTRATPKTRTTAAALQALRCEQRRQVEADLRRLIQETNTINSQSSAV